MPDRDPNLIVVTTFEPGGGQTIVVVEEVRKGMDTGAAAADFTIRLSGIMALDGGGTFGVSPKSDPIAILKTMSGSDSSGGTVVKEQVSSVYRQTGTGDLTMMAELINPGGNVISTSSLTKRITLT